MSWLYYLAEANIYLGVFYLAYCVFLNRDTHYQLNRAYLIFSCVVSFILPVLQIGALKPVSVPNHNTVIVRSIPAAASVTSAVTIAVTPVVTTPHFTLQDGLWYAYMFGAGILLLTLLIKLYTLFRLMRNEQCIRQDKYKVIYLSGSDVAFSFFNYLFIGTNAPGADTIMRHELVHIRQKHSADIIFLELLKIINWFNPCIYLLQKSLKTVHEYIADEQTAAFESDALTYSSFLVNNAYGASGSSITHSFFNYNLLKKRIIMLNQQRSGNLARLKYLMAVPICAGLLCASTLAFSKTYGWVDVMPGKHLAKTSHYRANKEAFINKTAILQKDIVITGFAIKAKASRTSKNIIKAHPVTIATKTPIIKEVSPQVSIPAPAVILDTVSKNVSDMFYKYLARNIHYSTDARDNNITGRVIASFSVTDNKIDNITILRGLAHGLDEEVIRVLKKYTPSDNMSAGKYIIPFAFVFGSNNPQTAPADIKDDKVNTYQTQNTGAVNLDEVVIVIYKN